MTHYICTGQCNGVADTEGTCQAQTCDKYNEPLTACECENGTHDATAEETSESSEG